MSPTWVLTVVPIDRRSEAEPVILLVSRSEDFAGKASGLMSPPSATHLSAVIVTASPWSARHARTAATKGGTYQRLCGAGESAMGRTTHRCCPSDRRNPLRRPAVQPSHRYRAPHHESPSQTRLNRAAVSNASNTAAPNSSADHSPSCVTSGASA